MSRIKSVFGVAPAALVSAVVVGLALGPETVIRRVDEALAASWRALGDCLASRELDAISRQLDRERQDAARIEVLRNGLREREGELLVLRAAADARQMDRALAGPVGDPSLWDVRVAGARGFLRTTPSDNEPRGTRLELSILP